MTRQGLLAAVLAVVLAVVASACSSDLPAAGLTPAGPTISSTTVSAATVPVSTAPAPTAPVPTTTVAPTTSTTSTKPATTEPATTEPATTTAATTPPATDAPATDAPATAAPEDALDAASYPTLEAAVAALAIGNVAVSVSVRRAGVEAWGDAFGTRVDGRPVTADTPFVIASVSKLVTALSIARLVERGDLTTLDVVPWEAMGLRHDPAWNDVTVRELLDHTSGMPINRKSWLDDPGSCSIPLEQAIAAPPTIARTTWQYSNGNYCALGLLVEHLTGTTLDLAADELVFGPAGITGPYLSTEGLRPDSAPSLRSVARLERLGGAGTWLASTDDLTAMLTAVTGADLEVLRWPGIILDQYGWGHTGSVDGAEACAWVMEGGRTTIAAIVSGRRPVTGGKVCDKVLPALATDLGIPAGDPVRNPD